MVLLRTTAAGLFLCGIGLLILTVLTPFITMEIQDVQPHNIEPRAQFLVGDLADRSYVLPAAVPVFGKIDVAEAPTNQTADIHFIVLNAENYGRWASGQQSDFLFSTEKEGQFNFTFKTDGPGTYHFVFDNRASVYKKYVTLSVAYNELSTSRMPDPRARYLAWILLAIGGLVSVYGILRKNQVHWA